MKLQNWGGRRKGGCVVAAALSNGSGASGGNVLNKGKRQRYVFIQTDTIYRVPSRLSEDCGKSGLRPQMFPSVFAVRGLRWRLFPLVFAVTEQQDNELSGCRKTRSHAGPKASLERVNSGITVLWGATPSGHAA
jgi:hypothetical protein